MKKLYFACIALAACTPRDAMPPETAVLAPVAVPTAPAEPDPPASADLEVAPMEVAISDSQICVRLDGKIHCSNGDDRNKPLSASPALVGIDGAISLALGQGFGCAATRAGAVWCWGSNVNGELGAGKREEQVDQPVRAKGIEKARRVFAGSQHACALLESGEVRCWGSNGSGQTANATAYESGAHELVVPAPVPGIKDAVAGAATYGATCVVTKSKEVWCWGESVFLDQQSQRGDTNEQPWKTKLAGIEQIAAGDRAFCGIKSGTSSEVQCWGESYSLFNDYRGKANDARTVKIPEPKKVRLAQSHACAIAGDARVYCWGSGYSGALGRDLDETKSMQTQAPEPVVDIHAIDIAVGGQMTCAITRDTEVFCWGRWPWQNGQQRWEKTPVAMRVR